MQDFKKKHAEYLGAMLMDVEPCVNFDEHLERSVTALYASLLKWWTYYPVYLRLMVGKFHCAQRELIGEKLMPDCFFSSMGAEELKNKRVLAASGVGQYLAWKLIGKESTKEKTIAECVAFVKSVVNADFPAK